MRLVKLQKKLKMLLTLSKLNISLLYTIVNQITCRIHLLIFIDKQSRKSVDPDQLALQKPADLDL